MDVEIGTGVAFILWDLYRADYWHRLICLLAEEEQYDSSIFRRQICRLDVVLLDGPNADSLASCIHIIGTQLPF
jgi:hypothetical protein